MTLDSLNPCIQAANRAALYKAHIENKRIEEVERKRVIFEHIAATKALKALQAQRAAEAAEKKRVQQAANEAERFRQRQAAINRATERNNEQSLGQNTPNARRRMTLAEELAKQDADEAVSKQAAIIFQQNVDEQARRASNAPPRSPVLVLFQIVLTHLMPLPHIPIAPVVPDLVHDYANSVYFIYQNIPRQTNFNQPTNTIANVVSDYDQCWYGVYQRSFRKQVNELELELDFIVFGFFSDISMLQTRVNMAGIYNYGAQINCPAGPIIVVDWCGSRGVKTNEDIIMYLSIYQFLCDQPNGSHIHFSAEIVVVFSEVDQGW